MTIILGILISALTVPISIFHFLNRSKAIRDIEAKIENFRKQLAELEAEKVQMSVDGDIIG